MANPVTTNTNKAFKLHHVFNQRLLEIKDIYYCLLFFIKLESITNNTFSQLNLFCYCFLKAFTHMLLT